MFSRQISVELILTIVLLILSSTALPYNDYSYSVDHKGLNQNVFRTQYNAEALAFSAVSIKGKTTKITLMDLDRKETKLKKIRGGFNYLDFNGQDIVAVKIIDRQTLEVSFIITKTLQHKFKRRYLMPENVDIDKCTFHHQTLESKLPRIFCPWKDLRSASIITFGYDTANPTIDLKTVSITGCKRFLRTQLSPDGRFVLATCDNNEKNLFIIHYLEYNFERYVENKFGDDFQSVWRIVIFEGRFVFFQTFHRFNNSNQYYDREHVFEIDKGIIRQLDPAWNCSSTSPTYGVTMMCHNYLKKDSAFINVVDLWGASIKKTISLNSLRDLDDITFRVLGFNHLQTKLFYMVHAEVKSIDLETMQVDRLCKIPEISPYFEKYEFRMVGVGDWLAFNLLDQARSYFCRVW